MCGIEEQTQDTSGWKIKEFNDFTKSLPRYKCENYCQHGKFAFTSHSIREKDLCDTILEYSRKMSRAFFLPSYDGKLKKQAHVTRKSFCKT